MTTLPNKETALEILRTWNADPALRAEFGDDLDRYRAYFMATAAGYVTVAGKYEQPSRPAA